MCYSLAPDQAGGYTRVKNSGGVILFIIPHFLHIRNQNLAGLYQFYAVFS
jgi:hypothetical protein